MSELDIEYRFGEMKRDVERADSRLRALERIVGKLLIGQRVSFFRKSWRGDLDGKGIVTGVDSNGYVQVLDEQGEVREVSLMELEDY